MPTPNPDYDPKAIEFQTAHAEALERLEELREKIDSDDFFPEDAAELAILAAKTEANEKAFHRTFYTMHPTIQGYAEWLFGLMTSRQQGFPIDPKDIDVERLKTREDVTRLYDLFNETAKTFRSYGANQLPIGQPEGLNAFEDERRLSSLRLYIPLMTPIGTSVTEMPTLIDDIDNRRHVAFVYEPQESRSVVNGIEDIATAFYWDDQKGEEKHHRTSLPPANYSFYIYIPPQYTEESFMKVPMSFLRNEFCRPAFEHYKSVPKVFTGKARATMQEKIDHLRFFCRKKPDAPNLSGG